MIIIGITVINYTCGNKWYVDLNEYLLNFNNTINFVLGAH